ncbi:GlxA family transcriptional regulator [Nocardia farcinica]|uniref:GlxA family transcriptional regulator n=1 Tax=Nocardia farcinica TaxID=37329 RepID=UPI000A3ACA98|nr:helix-turn-helix domain-containing protein [Nocardia farcinica]MBA4855711.1 helix-turn-helix domain-containing protein [Nocardia farcinica]MBC9817220.1 helix-turn-helix domain-containing protein [Nocardia farcinica]MBF6539211.1 helix-turn-helix domain-containing protein [Nocardia farcinica]MCZ9329303.1 helix-turn-helix domain-containing protein [Nocardia farcinica]
MQIAVYAFDGFPMFHLAVPLTVFGEVGRLALAADWQTRLWSDRAGSVRTAEGYPIGDVAGPEILASADIVVVPSWLQSLAPAGDDLKNQLIDAHRRGATIAGLCFGAFPLADAGLLDGRAAVTHWEVLPLLAERRPDTSVDASVLYIDHGDVLTSAGTASAIDACLHLVRKHLGVAAATRVARSLVVAPHREGGQAQYIERPLARPATDGAIGEVLDWALAHLDHPLTVDLLAERARMSRRSFVRHFQQATGTTPARWILDRRLDEARALLETTDWPIDTIASACGFGSPVTLRQNFAAAYGTTPTTYRRRFAPTPA